MTFVKDHNKYMPRHPAFHAARRRKIVRFIASNPGATFREIANEVGVSSTFVIRGYLVKLRADGWITYQDKRARTIQLAPGVFVNSKGKAFKVW